MSKKCVVGGVLSMDSGRRFGFKISFDDIETAIEYKRYVIKILEQDSWTIRSERGYHE